jgi:hypothetical protein
MHSKFYRRPERFAGKKVMVIGNSASGHDITIELPRRAQLPVIQSRRSKSRWDRDEPPQGITWKPVITKYNPRDGSIAFADGSLLRAYEVDHIIYCTGYQPSYPFWNAETNGGPLYDYDSGRLVGNYIHTFLRDHPTLGVVGMPKTLTFRSFEYQAIALARIFAGRNARSLPDHATMTAWEHERSERCRMERRKFHDIPYDNGMIEMMNYLRELYDIAGLPTLEGDGKVPPVLNAETRAALRRLKKYPEPGDDVEDNLEPGSIPVNDGNWVVVNV